MTISQGQVASLAELGLELMGLVQFSSVHMTLFALCPNGLRTFFICMYQSTENI